MGFALVGAGSTQADSGESAGGAGAATDVAEPTTPAGFVAGTELAQPASASAAARPTPNLIRAIIDLPTSALGAGRWGAAFAGVGDNARSTGVGVTRNQTAANRR
jgi:hypothetical protein